MDQKVRTRTGDLNSSEHVLTTMSKLIKEMYS